MMVERLTFLFVFAQSDIPKAQKIIKMYYKVCQQLINKNNFWGGNLQSNTNAIFFSARNNSLLELIVSDKIQK